MGIVVGVASLGASATLSAGTVVSCLGVLNSVDDATTDLYGETFAMRRFDTEMGKRYVVYTKNVIGITNIVYDGVGVATGSNTTQNLISTFDAINGIAGFVITNKR